MNDNSTRGAAKGEIAVRTLGVLLIATWIVSAILEIGPPMARPVFLVLGTLISWMALQTWPS